MENCKSINYLIDEAHGIELIVCNRSMLSYPVHNHVSVYTVGLITQGIVNVSIGDNLYQCKEGDVFAAPPYLPHSIQPIEEYSMLSLCISWKMIESVGFVYIRDWVKKMLCHAGELDNRNLYINNMLFVLCELFKDNITPHLSMSEVVNATREKLELFPEEKVSVEDMARFMFVSKYHFIRTFQREVGLTPHQFQMQNRIRRAQKLLLQADKITQVALDTGFCDQSHFIKQFKKIVRLTPSEYITSCSMIDATGD